MEHKESQILCVAMKVVGSCGGIAVVLELASKTTSTISVEDVEDWRAQICGSMACVLAIATKSKVGGCPEIRALVSI